MYLQIFDDGLRVIRHREPVISCGSSSSLRGQITSFSAQSRRRLRETLLTMFIPSAHMIGITLTLPYKDIDDSAIDDFKVVNHRFQVYWARRFPHDALIYRVELQKRGAPHLHCLAYHKSVSDFVSDYYNLWLSSLNYNLRGGLMSDFARFGVRVDSDVKSSAVFRYLCDHSSKSKQAQLGYTGKQWGIINRKNLVRRDFYKLALTDYEMVRLVRCLRKITRFRVPCPCVFGNRLVGGRGLSCRISYVNNKTIDSFVHFLRSEKT